MKLSNVAIATLGAVAVAVVAPAAFAGTSVTNSYSTRNVYNGKFKSDFSQTSYKNYRQYNSSESIKAVAEFGDVNVTNVSYKNGQLSGSAHSSNRRPVDPVSILSVSKQTEYVYGSERSTVRGSENYSFTGTERRHTTSADSF